MCVKVAVNAQSLASCSCHLLIDLIMASCRERRSSGGSPMSTSTDGGFGFDCVLVDEESNSDNLVNVMLVTANVGSVFEWADFLMAQWMERVVDHIAQREVKFVALHFQEIGGKSVRDSSLSKSVSSFLSSLLTRVLPLGFNRHVAIFDVDVDNCESFTALGSLYLIHGSLSTVEIFDFEQESFETLDKSRVLVGSLDKCTWAMKRKFPLELFPHQLWSRKGFLKTRWRFSKLMSSSLELVNVHLFHDACNLVAFFESWPSLYSSQRRRALDFVLEHCEKESVLFVFGDFNFRLDGPAVLEHLVDHLRLCQPELQAEQEELQHSYYVAEESGDRVRLSVRRKEFYLDCLDELLLENWHHWQAFDSESHHFSATNRLHELPIAFPPTYPFEESLHVGHKYMRTRCPAWCDRVLFSPRAMEVMDKPHYGVVGANVGMGDHKPVALSCCIKPSQHIE